MHHHSELPSQTEAAASSVDIDGLVRFFHEEARLKRRLVRAATVNDQVSKWSEELMALRSAYDLVHQRRGTVGTMPPTPHTLRGRVGAFFVRLAQRMLFWYTPQITGYNEAVTRALSQVCEAAESQLATVQFLSAEIAQLRREVSALSVQGMATPQAPATAEFPETFYSSFQEHFRGPQHEVAEKLGQYLRVIDNAGVPQTGPWLDFGCGRGEWLQLAGLAGQDAIGVDTSAAAVAYCLGQNLRAEEADALTYLRRLEPQSVSVITAFHVLEHWPVPYTLQFATEAVRVLRPGGLLVVELPNPENLLMAARDFWVDPTHRRPIPPATLEFLFSYCGLAIRQRLDLHPSPERERLPFADHEVVQRLDQYLHGPQAYALVGQK